MATTIYGASGPTISGPDVLEYVCGSNSVSRSMTYVTQYKGKGNGFVTKYLAAGHKMFWNLNYEPVKKSGGGDKLANPFVKDLERYRNLIDPMIKYYSTDKNRDNLILVCENEPTTKGFHSGPMSDYLAMLEVFVEVATKYGMKAVDGAVHVDRVNSAKQPNTQMADAEGDDEDEDRRLKDLFPDIRFGYETFEGGSEEDDESEYAKGQERLLRLAKDTQVSDLLNGYAKIKGLYAVNLHTANIGQSFESAKIKRCTDKIKSWTGHNSISNEWHVENTNNTDLVNQIAKGWYDAGVEWSVYISGAGGNDIDLNNGKNLTQFGETYKKFILAAK